MNALKSTYNHTGNTAENLFFSCTPVYRKSDQFFGYGHEKRDTGLKNRINLKDFGWTMQGRSFVGENYRNGYQGSERDPELLGGNSYTTEFRNLDVARGGWWTPDPIRNASWSPYTMMNDNPIYFTDPLGLEGDGGTVTYGHDAQGNITGSIPEIEIFGGDVGNGGSTWGGNVAFTLANDATQTTANKIAELQMNNTSGNFMPLVPTQQRQAKIGQGQYRVGINPKIKPNYDQNWGTVLYGNAKTDLELPTAEYKNGTDDVSTTFNPVADLILALAEEFGWGPFFKTQNSEGVQMQVEATAQTHTLPHTAIAIDFIEQGNGAIVGFTRSGTLKDTIFIQKKSFESKVIIPDTLFLDE